MGNVVGLMGDSGSGKTTAFRNVDPKTTMYVDCDKKGLSWKGWKKAFNAESKNYLVTDFPKTALEALVAVNTMPDYKHIKLIVFDTINGLMVADEMRRMKEKITISGWTWQLVSTTLWTMHLPSEMTSQ